MFLARAEFRQTEDAMQYQSVGSPSVETHSENLMRLFVRDANGAPVGNTHVKVWAGPPPTGDPPYFRDDVPFRATNPSGMLEYLSVAGTMPDSRDYWMQVLDNNGAPLSVPIQFHFPQGSTIWVTATVQAGTGTPTGGGTPPPLNMQWDPRLTPSRPASTPFPKKICPSEASRRSLLPGVWRLAGRH